MVAKNSRTLRRGAAVKGAAVSLKRSLGYHDAEDADTVIWSSEAMALVHDGPGPATARQAEWVRILAAKLVRQPVVVSEVGFSRGAVEMAEGSAVATFTITAPGAAAGCDSLGKTLLRNARCRAEGKLPPPFGLPDSGRQAMLTLVTVHGNHPAGASEGRATGWQGTPQPHGA
jgi:hypothetical protein